MHSEHLRRNRCSSEAAIGSASHRVGMPVLVRIVVHFLLDVDADIGRSWLVDPHGYIVVDGLDASLTKWRREILQLIPSVQLVSLVSFRTHRGQPGLLLWERLLAPFHILKRLALRPRPGHPGAEIVVLVPLTPLAEQRHELDVARAVLGVVLLRLSADHHPRLVRLLIVRPGEVQLDRDHRGEKVTSRSDLDEEVRRESDV
jgi:hypothetical protein